MLNRTFANAFAASLAVAALMSTPVSAGDGGPDLPQCATVQVTGTLSVSLFIGGASTPVSGRITLGLGNPCIPVPEIPGAVAVEVLDLRLVATEWSPSPLIFDEPLPIFLDEAQSSQGLWNHLTDVISFSAFVTTPSGGFPVPMPIELDGTFDGESLDVAGSNGNIPDATISLSISGERIECADQPLFSTEVGFTAGGSDPVMPGSDGDLLGELECFIATQFQLTNNLGFKPIVPPLGLDAVTNASLRPIFFSLEEPQFSAFLGPISDGDLLSSDGAIVRTHVQLLEAFWPIPADPEAGLDAVHFGAIDGSAGSGFLFSTEEDFWSEQLKQMIGHGDLLRDDGAIVRTNAELLAKFDVERGKDFGLDAVFIRPNGEIWFSTEGTVVSGFGVVPDGAILSDQGYIVANNLDLMNASCQPLEDIANFGLDALDRDACAPCPYDIPADLNGDGLVNAADLALLLGNWGCTRECIAELNGTPPVNAADLALLLGSWTTCD